MNRKTAIVGIPIAGCVLVSCIAFALMERLEGTGGFNGLLSRQEEVTDQRMYKAVLQGMYVPAVSDAARQGN